MQTISIIAAIERSCGLGKDGKIPWHLPADFARFKQITMGHPIIMGSKTFASIGKPLPGRRNIVLAREADFVAPGCEVAHSLDEAFALAGDGEVFVIGGGEIYKAALPKAQKLYLTLVDADFSADVFFPEIDEAVWQEVERVPGVVDEKNPQPHSFVTYIRKVA